MSKDKKNLFDPFYFVNNPAEWNKFKHEQSMQRDKHIKLRDYLTELILSKGKNLKFYELDEETLRNAGIRYYPNIEGLEMYVYDCWKSEPITITGGYDYTKGNNFPSKNLYEKVLMILQDLNYHIGFSTAIDQAIDLMVMKLNGKNLDERFLTLEDLREVSFILDGRNYFKEKSDTKKKWSDTIKKVQSIIDENLRNGKKIKQSEAIEELIKLGTDKTLNLELKSKPKKNIISNIIRDMTR